MICARSHFRITGSSVLARMPTRGCVRNVDISSERISRLEPAVAMPLEIFRVSPYV
jgi:hypothetical protein